MNQLEEQAQQEAISNSKCDQILVNADKLGLQLELVYSALEHKGQFPQASMLECLQVGADEWDV